LHWLTFTGAALVSIFYVARYLGNDAPMAPLLLMVYFALLSLANAPLD
jgi:hypothetical protein